MELQEQIDANEVLKGQYDDLHNKYEVLHANYENMVKRLTQIESQTQSPQADDSSCSVPSMSIPSTQNEISTMKGEALSASSSIAELQDVWSKVDNKLNNNIHDLNEVQQQMRKNSLLVHGLDDVPKKRYGLAFSKYIIEKLQELFPSIAHELKVEDIDVSHPLPSKKKSLVIVKFVRRDIKNMVFFEKKTLKNSPLKVSITEHLTPLNRWYLKEARELVGFKNAWTSQCIVYALVNNRKVRISSTGDLDFVSRNIKRNFTNRVTPSITNNINPPTVNSVRPSDIQKSQAGAIETLASFQDNTLTSD